FAPIAAKAGCVVVDNSSAFRMDDAVPLVVPEINAADVKKHQGIIANPNCTTVITLMALYPLHQAFGVKRIFASSYQAVSGTGARAIEELKRQVGEIVAGKPVTKEVYPHQIAFNVLPHVDSFLPTGYTKEEMKMENEGRKIMHHPAFRASVTCGRGPCSKRRRAWTWWTIRRTRNIRCRCSRPRNTTAKWAASGWIARWRTACVSGWRAISCSRARRSTPCRSPRNCSSRFF